MTTSPPPEPALLRWLRRVWLVGVIGGLTVMLICLLVIIVRGVAPGETFGLVLATASLMPVFCSLGIIASRAMRFGASALFMVVAMLCIAAAFIAWTALVWSARRVEDLEGLSVWFRIAGTLSIVGPGFALLGAAMTATRQGSTFRVLRRITMVSGSIAALCGLGLMWSPLGRRFMEVPMIVGGVAGIVLLGAVAALIIAYRVAAIRSRRRRESLPETLTIEITCPGCGDEAPRPTGASRCGNCNHVLLIEVDEPRCECGYLIYRLDQTQCPECGRELGVGTGAGC